MLWRRDGGGGGEWCCGAGMRGSGIVVRGRGGRGVSGCERVCEWDAVSGSLG